MRILQRQKRARRINKSLEQIADELKESVETIQPIYDIVKKHAPEYDADTITTEVLETRENEKV